MRKDMQLLPIGIFLLLMVYSTPCLAQNGTIDKLVDKSKLPVPNEKDQLFYLQRDPDANTVIYALNIQDGTLSSSHPIKAYWIRYAENNQREKLSFIQETMAYGVQTKAEGNDFIVRIKAYKPLSIRLSKDSQTDQYIAEVDIDDKTIHLSRIFVRINGGSFFRPNIEYVEISGTTKQGEEFRHRFEI